MIFVDIKILLDILCVVLCLTGIPLILILLIDDIVARRNKLKTHWLVVYNCKKKCSYIKYFESIKDKNLYLDKIEPIKYLFVIEDDSDIIYT